MSIFFFNDTATTEIYTLSLHDALPICLRCQLASLLQAIVELKRKLLFEEYHELRRGGAILCPAKAQNIHANLPRNFFRRATERGNGVGKSCAVHVHENFALSPELCDGLDFIMSVNRAELGCLGHADDARFVRVHLGLTRDHRVRFADVDLACGTAN